MHLRASAATYCGLFMLLAVPAAAQTQRADDFYTSLDAPGLAQWLRTKTGLEPASVVSIGSSSVIGVRNVAPTPNGPGSHRVAIWAEVINPKTAQEGGYMSWSADIDIDCANRRSKAVRIVNYAQRSLKGPAREVSGPAEWVSPGKGTQLQSLIASVCEPDFRRPLAQFAVADAARPASASTPASQTPTTTGPAPAPAPAPSRPAQVAAATPPPALPAPTLSPPPRATPLPEEPPPQRAAAAPAEAAPPRVEPAPVQAARVEPRTPASAPPPALVRSEPGLAEAPRAPAAAPPVRMAEATPPAPATAPPPRPEPARPTLPAPSPPVQVAAATPPPGPTIRTGSSSAAVQIAASASQAQAQQTIDKAKRQLADQMNGLSTTITTASVEGRTVYRALVHGFGGRSDANALCSALKAKGQDCFVRDGLR